jgi:multicomponent Na+:H+ antiporter subunit F
MTELATNISFGLLWLAVVFTLVRIVRGPTLADRILGLDTLSILCIGLIATYAVRSRLVLYDDVAVSLALVSPLPTLALARYLLARSGTE